MSEHIEFDPVERITVGAVGEPGQRVFLLQATGEGQTRTWILEKEHVLALGNGSYALLAQIGKQEVTRAVLGKGILGTGPPEQDEAMALFPDKPAFRIDPDSMALGYDDERNLVMIAFAEAVDSQAEGDVEGVLEDRSTIRLWITVEQLAALGVHGMRVASQGRPLCPICGGVMQDEHQCPPHVYNGHGAKKDR